MYTCDVDTSQLPFEIPEPKLNGKQQKLKRAKLRIARDRFRDMCFNDQLQACMRFEIDNDFLLMRKTFSHVRVVLTYNNNRDSTKFSKMDFKIISLGHGNNPEINFCMSR